MADPAPERSKPQPTGGLIVTFREGTDRAHQEECLHHCIGAGARSMSVSLENLSDVDADTPAVLLDDSGIAVVFEQAETTAIRSRLSADEAVREVRPEFWMYALDGFQDTRQITWGLQATGAGESLFTGTGIKLCILDTGIDAGHPDFAGRVIVSRSFVPGEAVDDGNGHGTHCAGTAAGGRPRGDTPRYGVAPGVSLYIGKVLGDNGAGRERDILAAMLWAIGEGCTVISMSLGRAVGPDEPPSPDYERIGRMALERGSLIVAAAGNESSRRYGHIAPVGAPANSPSILAVGALDQRLDVADFSCGGVNPNGGEVDLGAPGVGILSSVPRPDLYRTLQGTSMACPHVAGLAALWAERDAALRGEKLWQALTGGARGLNLPARDTGRGLARAPGGQAVS